MRIPQSRAALVEHLREQVEFLERSANAYDSGAESEAKRLAVVLRVLLHEGRRSNSRALLGSLGVRDALEFHDVVGAPPASAVAFVGLQMGFTPSGFRYYPKLGAIVRRVAFAEWWESLVLVQEKAGVRFSRRDAVLNLANTDGGAHVDRSLDAAYMRLSRDNAFGWEVRVGGSRGSVENSPALPIVRTAAHEVLGTLRDQLAEYLGEPR